MLVLVFSLGIILVFVVINGILILAERYFINKRKKWEKILPVLVSVIAICMIIPTGINKNSVTGAGVKTSYVGNFGETGVGIYLMVNKDRELISIGQLFFGEDEERKYISVKIENGKVTGSKEAMPYKEEIEDVIKSFGRKYTGVSKTYGELKAQEEVMNNERKYSFGIGNFLCGVLCYGITPAILWAMLLFHRWKRNKKNLLEKTRLEDL